MAKGIKTVFEYDFLNTSGWIFFSSAGHTSIEDAIKSANDDYANFAKKEYSSAKFYKITLRKFNQTWKEVERENLFPVFPPFTPTSIN